MIVFDLKCVCGYTFEGWFQDRSHFENQQTASFLECPLCSSRDVRKILSPIRYQSSGCDDGFPDSEPDHETAVSMQEAQKALDTLQKFVEINFEDVGVDLAKEALKIHYGVSEPRNIRGIATKHEEEKLKEEGVGFLKIPMPIKNDKTN